MSRFTLSRRGFMSSLAATTSALALASHARIARAQGKTVLNARMQRDIEILDPGFMVGGSEIDVQNTVMPRLIEFAHEGGKVGWRKSPHTQAIAYRDDTHIDFTLTPGLMWTNGHGEFTAEDVKFSYERMKTSDWKGFYDALDHVEVKDAHNGTLVMNKAYAPFWLTTLASGPGLIMCKTATEAAGGKYTTEIPATCGPYLYNWTPKQRIVFTRNPEWTGPTPYFDEINYIDVKESNAAELAYEAGELDITLITAATYARYLKETPKDSTLNAAGSLQYMWMGMNTEHPKLKDRRIRRAIQHAVDVDSILQGAYSGTAERAYGIVPPGILGKRNETKTGYDPDKAKALLSEAGASGLSLVLNTLNVQERMLASQVIQANLGAVGIEVKIIPLDSGPFWNLGQEKKGDDWKDAQMWLMRFGTNPDPADPFQWFVKDQIGIWNWERWSDPEFDELYQKGIVEIDEAKRTEIYLRMQEIMEDTGAYVWISHEPEVFIHRSNLEPDLWPTGQLNLRNFRQA